MRVLTLDPDDDPNPVPMAVETLVMTTADGRVEPPDGGEQSTILALCGRGPVCMAEIAARTRLSFFAARSVVTRMITSGLVALGQTAPDDRDPRRADLLRRLIGGLHAL